MKPRHTSRNCKRGIAMAAEQTNKLLEIMRANINAPFFGSSPESVHTIFHSLVETCSRLNDRVIELENDKKPSVVQYANRPHHPSMTEMEKHKKATQGL